MPTSEEVLALAKRLPVSDQARLQQALSANMIEPIEVEGTDEVISVEKIAESEAAWQNYQAGRDAGMTAAELKQKLFGGNLG